MKKLFSVLCIFLLPCFCFAQLRSNVCIVKQNYSEGIISNIKSLFPRLRNLKVENTKKYLDDFLENYSYGSGFVYVGSDGKNYIITNRHVVDGAETYDIVFEDEDGNVQKEYKKLKVLAANPDIDVAIIPIPDILTKKGIAFYDGKIKEGDSVYTVGYPDLHGKPSWQFGSGIITNSSVKVEELINPEISTIIQHSSQIDSGNSGGPLLIKNNKDEYEIIGINTWKVLNRQDTNFAVPIKTVQKFIDQVISKGKNNSNTPEDSIIIQAKKLQQELTKKTINYYILSEFISLSYISSEGAPIVEKIFYSSSNNMREWINENLIDGNPVEVMENSIIWYIYNQYNSNSLIKKNQNVNINQEKKLPDIPIPMKYEKSNIWYTYLYNNETSKYLKTEWICENGKWMLYAAQSVLRKEAERAIDRIQIKVKPETENKVDDSNNQKLQEEQKLKEEQEKEAQKKKQKEEQKRKKKEQKPKFIRQFPDDKVLRLKLFDVYFPDLISIGYYANPFTLAIPSKNYSHQIDIGIKLNNFLSIEVTPELLESFIQIFKEGETPQYLNGIGTYAGLQVHFPVCFNYFLLMPYVTVQGGIQFTDFSNIKFDVGMNSKAGLRTNIFLSKKGNATVFVDMAFLLEMKFINFSVIPKASIGAGVAF